MKTVISNHGQVETVLRLSRQGTDERSLYQNISLNSSIFSYAKGFAERHKNYHSVDGHYKFLSGELAVIEESSVANRLIPVLCHMGRDTDYQKIK